MSLGPCRPHDLVSSVFLRWLGQDWGGEVERQDLSPVRGPAVSVPV